MSSALLITYAAFVSSRAKVLHAITDDYHHAATGAATEAGEILSATKKLWIYGAKLTDIGEKGQTIDENLDEETGDVLFYLQHLCNLRGVTIEGCIERNMEKLLKRYPAGYSDAAALDRADKKD